MNKTLIICVLLSFGLNIYSQEHVELSEREKQKLVEEVTRYTEGADFILYVDACVCLMELTFKSENSDYEVNSNILFGSGNDYSKPELLGTLCKWQSREIIPINQNRSEVTGVFGYFIMYSTGRSYCGKNQVKCELVRTAAGWKINMKELLVFNDKQVNNLY